MKWFLAGLSLGIIITGIFFVTAQVQKNTPGALAQGGVPPVTNIQVRNGPNLGEGIISWDAVPQATHYRIGYVNMEVDYHLASASCTGEWIDAFVYVDADARNIPVRNGRAEYTVRRLAPGARHAFTVLTSNNFTDSGRAGSVRSEFFWPSNPRWKFLAGRSDLPSGVALPTGECTTVITGDYDADDDGLIEVSNLTQLNAIRWDLDGNGSDARPYAAAFPDAVPGMGCPNGCIGYELVADLDFDTNGNGEADAGDAYWNDGKGWMPIGGRDHRFNTIFDGGSHTIANLHMNRRHQYVGLFSYVGRDGVVQQVGLINVNVNGFWDVGSLAGWNAGIIETSSAIGSVSGDYAIGGLVGWNGGRITSSYAIGTVSSLYNIAGGLAAGTGSSSVITGSYTQVDITGRRNLGGIVGESRGGIINNSYSTGSIQGDLQVGGLIGEINTPDVVSEITNSYSTGNISGRRSIGGLIATNSGGVIISDSYWDVVSSGASFSAGGVGRTTKELQSPTANTGIYAEWDLDYWDFGTSSQYPVLKYGGLSVADQR